jgi:hypothetical protein
MVRYLPFDDSGTDSASAPQPTFAGGAAIVALTSIIALRHRPRGDPMRDLFEGQALKGR